MKKETIVYREKKYNRYPDSNRRHLRVYFWRHDKWKLPPFALHRQIWIDNKGEIPKGYIIHHKDNNPLNNEIENLELMLHGDHTKIHSKEPERLKQLQNNGRKQTERLKLSLKKYKNSKKGREFYSKNTKGSILSILPQKKECLECKIQFSFFIKQPVKFCSKLCGARFRRKNT